MNRRRRVLVWLWICREAWWMLRDMPDPDLTERVLSVALDTGKGPGVTTPRYVLAPDAAVVSIQRNVRDITEPADKWRSYEADGTTETIVLAYGQRSPARVTS